MPDIKKTAELVEEISAACREQDVGANQVNQAIQQLDKVIQQNAGAAEEMSATSEALSGQAEHLLASIAFFRIDGKAGGARNERSSAPALPQTKTPAPAQPGAAQSAPHARARRKGDETIGPPWRWLRSQSQQWPRATPNSKAFDLG